MPGDRKADSHRREIPMKKLFLAAAVVLAATNAHATQETFTTAGPLDCSSVSVCTQKTSDGLFLMSFVPTWPTSAPSATGFNVAEKTIGVFNANGGTLDLNGMSVTLTGSEAYNGVNFLGAIELDVQDAAGNWKYVTQWSTWIGSSKGIYVLFTGKNLQSPLVRNVYGVRLVGVNGATAFRIGMMNLTAH
jgi:hypothetical protein